MAARSKNRTRLLNLSGFCQIGVGLLFCGLILVAPKVFAQTEPRPSTSIDSQLPKHEQTNPVQTGPGHVGLKQVVKIIIEPGTNRIFLVGSTEDIAIVKRTLKSIKERMNQIADPTVTEKVVLKSQLAETVATIMSNSFDAHATGGTRVKISAVHHPEAIVLVGPSSAVERAKQLLATIDRYEGLSTSDPPVKPRID